MAKGGVIMKPLWDLTDAIPPPKNEVVGLP